MRLEGAWAALTEPGPRLLFVPHFVGLDAAWSRMTHAFDRPWATMYAAPQSIAPLLAMSDKDMADGLMDAPWPPVYPKMPNEPPRVAPSRAKKDP